MRLMVFAVTCCVLLTIAAQVVADEYWGDWTQMDPPTHPCARAPVGMAYDTESDRIVLFGGWDGGNWLGDTWAYDYDADTWAQMSPGSGPCNRSYTPLIYDAESDRAILFGGYDWSHHDDTWAYDYNTDTWAQTNPPFHPGARALHGAAYDAESDRVILFGGSPAPYAYLDETWAYDYNTNTWERMAPVNRPPPCICSAMAYDRESDRVILFGGREDVNAFGETWAYDYNTDAWQKMSPASPPAARWGAGTAYHAETDRVILFGGDVGGGNCQCDTWAYDYDTDTWTELTPSGQPSPRKVYYCMEYDVESVRVVLFGGWDDSTLSDDTWVFETGRLSAPEDWLWPYWNWISIPGVPDDPNPDEVLGFDCGGRLWYWDKYGKWHQVYRPPFVSFEMEVGPSYLMWLDEFPPPVSYDGYLPDMPFEFKMGRMGWTWLGKPGLQPLGKGEFMDTVMVRYPSDESGELRTAREDWSSGDPWLSWGWSYWDPYAQAPRTFTPYLPWHNVCYPWCGYRCWVRIGAALDENDPDQVTLIWP